MFGGGKLVGAPPTTFHQIAYAFFPDLFLTYCENNLFLTQ